MLIDFGAEAHKKGIGESGDNGGEIKSYEQGPVLEFEYAFYLFFYWGVTVAEK